MSSKTQLDTILNGSSSDNRLSIHLVVSSLTSRLNSGINLPMDTGWPSLFCTRLTQMRRMSSLPLSGKIFLNILIVLVETLVLTMVNNVMMVA